MSTSLKTARRPTDVAAPLEPVADLAADAARDEQTLVDLSSIALDPDLGAYDRQADRMITQEIAIAGRRPAKPIAHTAPILSTEIMGALKYETNSKAMRLMRALRLIDSQEMRDAWADKNVTRMLACVLKHNVLVYFIQDYGIDITVREFGCLVERYLTKMIGAAKLVPWANVVAGVLLLAGGLVYQGFAGTLTKSSACLELVKAAGVVLMPLAAYIPFHSILNSTVPFFTDQVAAGKSYKQAAGIALFAYLAELPIIGKFFRGRPLVITVDPIEDAYPDAFVHSSFADPISLELIKEPVFLHGRPWEREQIERALAIRPENPLTRAPARPMQLATPPADYMRCLTEYTMARRRIMHAAAAGAQPVD